MTASETGLPAEADGKLQVFRKRLPLQVELQEVMRYLGATEGLSCLDVGLDNPAMSYQLRRRGGTWRTAVSEAGLAETVGAFLDEPVGVATDGKLPFEDKQFDVVVVVDTLVRVESDSAFIQECHRVLNTDGRLVVVVPRIKSFSLLHPLRTVLGPGPQRQGFVRPGYSESELFRILKDGFDVHQMRSFSRFFVELTDTVAAAFCRRGGDGSAVRVYRAAAPFYWLALQLDILLFFTRGYRLVAVAKRRSWRPRNAPILSDGRTLGEALLSRASD